MQILKSKSCRHREFIQNLSSKLNWVCRADGDRERGRETRLPTPPASLPTNTTSRCESFACKRKSSRGGNNTLLVNTNKSQAQNRWSKKKISFWARRCAKISRRRFSFHFQFSVCADKKLVYAFYSPPAKPVAKSLVNVCMKPVVS